MTPGHPLKLVAASLALFLTCDGLIFRSGLYAAYSSPRSLVGTAAHTIESVSKRRPTGKVEVMVLGNSRIGVGFFGFEDRFENSPIEFVPGWVQGSDERGWYFLAKRMDPTHDRYSAIVVTLPNYFALGGYLNQRNSMESLDIAEAAIEPPDWPKVAVDLTEPTARRHALLHALISMRNYALDLQDLLLHPIDRMQELESFALRGERWRSARTPWKDGAIDWKSYHPWRSIEGFQADATSRRILSCPDGMPSSECEQFGFFDTPIPDELAKTNARANAAFRKYWLTQLLELYKNSKTIVVFAQLPRWPRPLRGRPQLTESEDIRATLPTQDNAVFLAADAFEQFEQPRYFFDADHLNIEGGYQFSEKFKDEIERVVLGRGANHDRAK